MTAPTRRELPTDREGLTVRFEIEAEGGQVHGYYTINVYEDGSPGELFVHMDKTGSTVSGLIDAWAITVSIALQHGVPLATICRKLSRIRFEPSGWTEDQSFGRASSVVDLICRRLLRWLGEVE